MPTRRGGSYHAMRQPPGTTPPWLTSLRNRIRVFIKVSPPAPALRFPRACEFPAPGRRTAPVEPLLRARRAAAPVAGARRPGKSMVFAEPARERPASCRDRQMDLVLRFETGLGVGFDFHLNRRFLGFEVRGLVGFGIACDSRKQIPARWRKLPPPVAKYPLYIPSGILLQMNYRSPRRAACFHSPCGGCLRNSADTPPQSCVARPQVCVSRTRPGAALRLCALRRNSAPIVSVSSLW